MNAQWPSSAAKCSHRPENGQIKIKSELNSECVISLSDLEAVSRLFTEPNDIYSRKY